MSCNVKMYNNADLILNKDNTTLWIGDYKAALDMDFITKNNISFIVNCTPDRPYIYQTFNFNKNNSRVKYLETVRIPINDSPDIETNNEFYKYLKKIIPCIQDQFLNKKKNILIHCAAGKSRSASVVAAFLFTLLKCKNEQTQNCYIGNSELMINIINYMITRRPCVFFYGTKLNFKNAIEKYCQIDLS